MISFNTKSLAIRGESSQIDRFEVWFATPFGLTADLDLAVDKCNANDMDPNLVIKAVPVAISVTEEYEVL